MPDVAQQHSLAAALADVNARRYRPVVTTAQRNLGIRWGVDLDIIRMSPLRSYIMLDARAQIGDDDGVDLPLADDETFRRAAGLVETLATQHGLSEVRLGQHGGELVVTVGADRDYFDLVRFEMELEGLLRARVRVVSSGAPGVRVRGPLRQDNAAA